MILMHLCPAHPKSGYSCKLDSHVEGESLVKFPSAFICCILSSRVPNEVGIAKLGHVLKGKTSVS